MEQHETDEKFMRLALNEAQKALKQQVVPPPDHRTAGHDDRTDGHLLLF